eukprot:TRINITY_DN157_c0_g1_i1.p1 TRINITY_DN157_c0_g1~~TRINITY_DN157_c0_g1_i1.p1  ORF type:complete len:209 (-),score=31.36 TRINITY_DN157_c0_g1_i1:86-712(-)
MGDNGTQQKRIVFRIIMIGDSDTGREDILVHFCEGKLTEENKLQLGEDSRSKEVSLNENVIKLIIVDPVGQEKFRTVTSSFFRKADGVFLVYDTMDDTSFGNIEHWLGEVKKYASTGISLGLLGHKRDESKPGIVKHDQAKAFAQKNNIKVFNEVSATTGEKISESFMALADLIYKHKILDTEEPKPEGTFTTLYTGDNKPQKRRCIL